MAMEELSEHIQRSVVDGVKLLAPRVHEEQVEGTLCISVYYLIFSTRRRAAEDELTVLHTAIDKVECKSGSTVVSLCMKDFRRFVLELSALEECQDVVASLERLSKPERLQELCAFHCTGGRQERAGNGWHFPTVEELFQRWHCPEEKWRISHANKDFMLCESYPEEVIVPKCVADDTLAAVANFRHSKRFPMLCFHHRYNNAVLLRSSQPLCGPSHKRCREDVRLLNACLPSLSRGKVLDVRPQDVAKQHTSRGGGVEEPSHYPQWKVEYAGMDPPSTIQSSLSKLLDACYDTALNSSSSWFNRLESSQWLSHVTKLLQAARFVTLCIHQDASSVLVHGASGKDASLQITSLAQVLLDPHCRTIEGFLGLVQREWLDCGHPFSLRHAHTRHTRDRAPVFLLFLDALWQVMRQFALSFEFNEQLLHILHQHSHFSTHGTFLYDTPKERKVQNLANRTSSLWQYLSSPSVLELVKNPLYHRNSSVIIISVHALSVTLWKKMYLRKCDIDAIPTNPTLSSEQELQQQNKQLREQLLRVRRDMDSAQADGRKLLHEMKAHKCSVHVGSCEVDEARPEEKSLQLPTMYS